MRLFDETPGMVILRNVLYAIVITIVYVLVMMKLWRFNAGFLPAYCVIGICFAFFGWGGERLWYVTGGKFFQRPDGWLSLPTRLPYWAMFGGMAYVVAIVVSKKAGLVHLYERPISDMFFSGAQIGCLIQLSLYVLNGRMKRLLKSKNNELQPI